MTCLDNDAGLPDAGFPGLLVGLLACWTVGLAGLLDLPGKSVYNYLSNFSNSELLLTYSGIRRLVRLTLPSISTSKANCLSVSNSAATSS